MPQPRILTFNFHEPYLCLMAKTGYRLSVGLYEQGPLARTWQTQFRPVPPNIEFVPEAQWRADIAAARYDVAIAHNESNALDLLRGRVPKILVCHNRKTFLREAATIETGDVGEAIERLLARLRQAFEFVFISESKRADYGVPGRVILPGMDVEEYGGYTGGIKEVLRVGNAMRERNLMFDVDLQEAACAGIANRIAGVDPNLPAARPAESFADLIDLYRTRRCLLHVTRQEYEDGYNLAMLEAMACGMPVVALANNTSPLTHGRDGLVGDSAETLRAHLQALLDDHALARTIGAGGRATVARKFPMGAFIEKWREAIEEAAEASVRHTPRTPPRPRRILMHYVASPFTTGRYFEAAARKKHRVVTAGLRCPETLLRTWGFTDDPPPYAAHDIDLALEASCDEILGRLPKDFTPDLYLWIDSGVKHVPANLSRLDCPKACYLIDTHLDPEVRLEIARHFDYVFLAQKDQVEWFRARGVANAAWLPLACSLELHAVGARDRIFDVAYVGSVDGDATDRRPRLLRAIRERFPNCRIGRFWPHEMAEIYAQSKIVFNACVNRDVNMRVFEGMASGALVITDEAGGLEDLFEDGRHLVVYRRDEDAIPAIERYLNDDEARERIAAAGQALVRLRHTYDLRLQYIVDAAETGTRRGGYTGESRFQPGGYYANTRPEVAQFVPLGVRRLLDVGCGCGDFGRALKQERNIQEVCGIEVVERAAAMARNALDRVLCMDVETAELPFDDGYFDCITFADVLEHLRDPGAVLRKAARVLADDGVMLMSVPNVRFYQVVAMLLDGGWDYADAGILDRTHLRFFTARTMRKMAEDAGLEVLCLQPLSMAPPGDLPCRPDGSLQLGRAVIMPKDDTDVQDLRTYQYMLIAGKPGADRLAKARDALHIEQFEAAAILADQALGVDAFEQRRIIAAAMARLGRLQESETLYREILRMRADPMVEGELGILLVAMNRPGEAHPLLERALTANPRFDRAWGALGLVHLSEGRLEEAFHALSTTLESSFDHPALLPHLIAAAEKLGRLDAIEDIVVRYMDFAPGNAELAYHGAGFLMKRGRLHEARERLETLIMFMPHHVAAADLLAEINRRIMQE